MTGDEGQEEVRVLLSHVAEVLLNTTKESLYKTQKLHMQEEEDKFLPDLVRTIWLQKRAFHNPFLPSDSSWFLGYTSPQEMTERNLFAAFSDLPEVIKWGTEFKTAS